MHRLELASLPLRLVIGALALGGFLLLACRNKESTPAVSRTPPVTAPSTAGSSSTAPLGSIHGLTMSRLDGTPAPLSTWAGKVVLVVNTASECGFTPQYEGLESLYERYEGKGFTILGFPSNDFGGQEPGSAPEIAKFCKINYGVTFPMFAKVATTGSDRTALYALLGDRLGPPKWNFHKYLVDRKGVPARAFPSSVDPSAPELVAAIDAELAKP